MTLYFYKSNKNKRILFGNPEKSIELVGPDGGDPNFQQIKWNLTNYTIIDDVSITFNNIKDKLNQKKDERFVSFMVNPEYKELYIFFNSPINRGKIPYISQYNNKIQLNHCSWNEFFNFITKPPRYWHNSDDHITLKKGKNGK